ncbi:MAG TPA: GNAT family N-acetyltransferase [Verrucomicrobiae bacterium]|nr:GNAT family N-acetyltransferase [Verrucomicrobiae bacterium]
MPPQTRIRRAGIEDAGTIARMVAALAEAEGGPAPHFDAPTYRRDGFGPKRHFEVLLAEIGGRPAGYALFHPSYDTDRVVRAAYLGDLYVEAWARGGGLGRLLAASVARLAAASGDATMHWTVLRRNAAARRFYARFAREDESLLHCFADAPALARLAAASPLSAASIRPAKAEDAPLLADFLARLMAALGEEAPAAPAAETVRRLADHGFGADPRFQALIAEAEAGSPAAGSAVGHTVGPQVGYALFWPIYDTDTGGPLMFLSDLFVEEEWRGRGLAPDLMAAVAGRAMAAGHKGMVWEVMRRNARARAFYRRLAEESDEAIVVNCAGDDFLRLAAEGLAIEAAPSI